MTRNMTRRLSGRVGGPSLEPPHQAERDMGRIDAFIEQQPYSWIRDQCDMFRRLNRMRGYRRRERFSAWLRERVEDQLIAKDYEHNRSWY